jgi:hypothetical protein
MLPLMRLFHQPQLFAYWGVPAENSARIPTSIFVGR